MTYIYRLAGENLEMAEGELKGFLRSQGISEEPERDGRLAETDSEPEQLKRLALTHEVVKEKAEIKIEELEDFNPEDKPGDSFSITCKKLAGSVALEFLKESQRYIGKYYLTSDKTWGAMKAERWESFIHWLAAHDLITEEENKRLKEQTVFTNAYLAV